MDIIICGMKVIADKVGCSRTTLAKWIQEEGFPAFKKDGIWRALPEDIREWLRAQARRGAPG